MANRPFLSKEFWAAASERAIKTGAQAALASGALQLTDLWSIDWAQFGSIIGLSMLASLFTSMASVKFGEDNSPSLGPEVLVSKGEENGGSNGSEGKHHVEEGGSDD